MGKARSLQQQQLPWLWEVSLSLAFFVWATASACFSAINDFWISGKARQ